MEQNPYESPRSLGTLTAPRIDIATVKQMVRGPAISLVVLAIMAMLLDVAIIANVAIQDAPTILASYGRDQGMPIVVANIVGNGLLFFLHLVPPFSIFVNTLGSELVIYLTVIYSCVHTVVNYSSHWR